MRFDPDFLHDVPRNAAECVDEQSAMRYILMPLHFPTVFILCGVQSQ